MKVYLVYAKIGNDERVVCEVFTSKKQAEAYVNYWDERLEETTFWYTEKETNESDWVKTERLFKQTKQDS